MPSKPISIGNLSPKFTEYSQKTGSIKNGDTCSKFRQFVLAFDHHEEFYAEVDITTQKITWTFGIQKWLGYPDPAANAEIPKDYLLQFIHPFIREWYKIYMDAAMLVFLQYRTHFLSSRINIHIPIRKSDGRFLLVKQMIMPFGMDDQGQIISFMNSFTLYGDFRGEPLSIKFFEDEKEISNWLYDPFESLIVSNLRFTADFKFPATYFVLLDCIFHLKNKGKAIDLDTIATTYNAKRHKKIDKLSIQKYLKRIQILLQELLQANGKQDTSGSYFSQFKDAYQFIDFCEQSGFISLLKRAGYDHPFGIELDT